MAPDENDRRAWRGYVILAGIIIAAVLIFNITAIRDLAGDRVDLVALLPDASGVRVGSPVSVAGVEAGRVQGIAFLRAGDSAEIALTIRIRAGAASMVRKDSDVRAVRTRLIGQPVVRIDPGTAAAPPVSDGDTLRAVQRLGAEQLLEQAKGLPAALDSLLVSAGQLGALARARQPEVERLSRQMDMVSRSAASLGDELEGGSLARMLGPGGALDGMARLQARLDTLSVAAGAALARYAGEGDAGLQEPLRELGGRVAALRAELDALQGRMQASGGIVHRLPRDSALQVAVRGVQAQIDSLRMEAASMALRMILP